MAQPTKMIVGLGNPGADYCFNRHNIGFMAADALAESCGGSAWQRKFKGLICEAVIATPAQGGGKQSRCAASAAQESLLPRGRAAAGSPRVASDPRDDELLSDQKTTCLLLKPHTFMNLSGESVGEAMRYYKLDACDVIVIHDDIALLSAQVKVKQGGGHGGHNGLKSIDAHIGKEYWRVRLGVGHPGSREEVTNHVLGNFAKADKIWLEPLLAALPQALPLLFKGDQGAFVQRLTATNSG